MTVRQHIPFKYGVIRFKPGMGILPASLSIRNKFFAPILPAAPAAILAPRASATRTKASPRNLRRRPVTNLKHRGNQV